VIAVNGAKLKVNGSEAYVWVTIDVDTKELISIVISIQRS